MKDMVEAGVVEIQVDDTGKVWVNVDGRCVLRIGHGRVIIVEDPVRGPRHVVHQDDNPVYPRSVRIVGMKPRIVCEDMMARHTEFLSAVRRATGDPDIATAQQSYAAWFAERGVDLVYGWNAADGSDGRLDKPVLVDPQPHWTWPAGVEGPAVLRRNRQYEFVGRAVGGPCDGQRIGCHVPFFEVPLPWEPIHMGIPEEQATCAATRNFKYRFNRGEWVAAD